MNNFNNNLEQSIKAGFKTAAIYFFGALLLNYIFEAAAKAVIGFNGSGQMGGISSMGDANVFTAVRVVLFISLTGMFLPYFDSKIGSMEKVNALFVVCTIIPICFGLVPTLLTEGVFQLKTTYVVASVWVSGMLLNRRIGGVKWLTNLLLSLIVLILFESAFKDLGIWIKEISAIAEHLGGMQKYSAIAFVTFSLCEAIKVALSAYVFFYAPHMLVKKLTNEIAKPAVTEAVNPV